MFDAVGTLIYPTPSVAVAYQQLGVQHGSKLNQQEIGRSFRLAIRRHNQSRQTSELLERQRWQHIVSDVFTDIQDSTTLFHELWDHFAQPSNWSVFDDVAPTFTALHAAGIQIAIASNFDTRLIEITKQLPPLDQIQHIFVSSRLGFAKPTVEFFRTIEQQLDLPPSQLLMVGDDQLNDFEGAANSGWHSVLVRRIVPARRQDALTSLVDVANVVARM